MLHILILYNSLLYSRMVMGKLSYINMSPVVYRLYTVLICNRKGSYINMSPVVYRLYTVLICNRKGFKDFITSNNFKFSKVPYSMHLQWPWINSIYLNSPLVAIRRTRDKTTNTSTHRILPCSTEGWPDYNLMCTVDHTFCGRSKKFTCACVKLSAHANNSNSEAELLNISKPL